MFFKVVPHHAGRAKGVQVPAASRGRVTQASLTVLFFDAIWNPHCGCIFAEPVAAHSLTNHLALLNLGAGELGSQAESLREWQPHPTTSFYIKGLPYDESLAAAVEVLVCAGALPGCAHRLIATSAVSYHAALLELESLKLACAVDQDSWCLTEMGSQSLRALTRLGSCRLVSEPRAGTDLAECSVHELMTMLRRAGWQWRQLPR